jgi:hypothetical protein
LSKYCYLYFTWELISAYTVSLQQIYTFSFLMLIGWGRYEWKKKMATKCPSRKLQMITFNKREKVGHSVLSQRRHDTLVSCGKFNLLLNRKSASIYRYLMRVTFSNFQLRRLKKTLEAKWLIYVILKGIGKVSNRFYKFSFLMLIGWSNISCDNLNLQNIIFYPF